MTPIAQRTSEIDGMTVEWQFICSADNQPDHWDNPPWHVLEQSRIGEAAPMFMYMGSVFAFPWDKPSHTTMFEAHAFKHVNTRRTIHLAESIDLPMIWRSSPTRHTPWLGTVSWDEAIEYVKS